MLNDNEVDARQEDREEETGLEVWGRPCTADRTCASSPLSFMVGCVLYVFNAPLYDRQDLDRRDAISQLAWQHLRSQGAAGAHEKKWRKKFVSRPSSTSPHDRLKANEHQNTLATLQKFIHSTLFLLKTLHTSTRTRQRRRWWRRFFTTAAEKKLVCRTQTMDDGKASERAPLPSAGVGDASAPGSLVPKVVISKMDQPLSSWQASCVDASEQVLRSTGSCKTSSARPSRTPSRRKTSRRTAKGSSRAPFSLDASLLGPDMSDGELRQALVAESDLRIERVKGDHRDHLLELYFLKNGGNILNFNSWKEKPNRERDEYMMQNKLEDGAGTGTAVPVSRTSVPVVKTAAQSTKAVSVSIPSSPGRREGVGSPPRLASPPHLGSPPRIGSPPRLRSPTLVTRSKSRVSRIESAPAPSEEIAQQARHEAEVRQRMADLQKNRLSSGQRLAPIQEPGRAKAHWDYLLEEMQWLAGDFAKERRWKGATARKVIFFFFFVSSIQKFTHFKFLVFRPSYQGAKISMASVNTYKNVCLARVRACVCVSKRKESARRVASTTCNKRKHNEKKSCRKGRGLFHQSTTVILTKEREAMHYIYTCHSLPASSPESRQEQGWQWVPRAGAVSKTENKWHSTKCLPLNNRHDARLLTHLCKQTMIHLAP